MAEQAATVNIPNDVIQPIVLARIQAAIVEGLGRESQLIEQAVTAALTFKVDSEGKRSNYTGYNSLTLLEWMATKAIQEAAQEALKTYLEKAKAQVRARVEKELQKKQGIIAAALVDGFAESIKSTYGFSIKVELAKGRHE